MALGLWGTVGAAAQQPAAPAPAAPQAGPIDGIVAAMQAAEQRASRFTVELTTAGQLPGDLALSTRGVLHVLRGAQPAVHTAVEFSFADGLGGRVESAQTAAGIVLYEENPAFGELYLRFAPELVADLEWAGSVLGRSDLPGMADRRAMAPLGSTMLVELQREFALGVVDGRRDRAGEPGTWLAGPRRGGLDDDGSGQPMADRVEVFVRDRDHALVEANWLQGERRVQQIVVQRLEVDGDLPPALFTVDGRGQRLRDVQQHQPMWDQIQQVLQKAEAKAPEGAVRPSRR
ncbi:MAG: hypothetical protein JNL08_01350 [Planctomycetes bacterium]|nr:hypothetical protein [Planctomycetota bacterium]